MMMMMRRRLGCCTRDTQTSLDFDEQHRGMVRYEGLQSCILNSETYEGSGSGSESGESYESYNKSSDDHDVAAMKDTFAKLLLGGDLTGGGSNGLSSALALSKAITSLGGAVFGELWKLEPLPRERLSKWRTQLRWLISPTAYMVELVPAKHGEADFQIMTPKPRGDVQMLLPALCKLDEMLIETLESVSSSRDYWYVGSEPRVPEGGLSDATRRNLGTRRRVVGQVFKAATSINRAVLLEMPVPAAVADALVKCSKYKAVLVDDGVVSCQHRALDLINQLEAASLASPRSVERANAIVNRLKTRHPNLPPTFLDVTKVRYSNDVAHSILEAYSRVVANLAFSILTRIEDVMRQDVAAATSTASMSSSSSSTASMSSSSSSTASSSSSTSCFMDDDMIA